MFLPILTLELLTVLRELLCGRAALLLTMEDGARYVSGTTDVARLADLLDQQQLTVLPSAGAPGEYTEDELMNLRLNLKDGTDPKTIRVHPNCTTADVKEQLALVLQKDKIDRAHAIRLRANDFWYGRKGEKIDMHKAIELWKESAELDDFISNYWLFMAYGGQISGNGLEYQVSGNGKRFKQNKKNALQNLKICADKGVGPAQWHLGKCYYFGERGLQKNLQLTVHWWTLAAEQNYHPAQHNLAAIYFNGEVGPNGSEGLAVAARFFKMAALNKYTDAKDCYRLALDRLTEVQALEASGAVPPTGYDMLRNEETGWGSSKQTNKKSGGKTKAIAAPPPPPARDAAAGFECKEGMAAVQDGLWLPAGAPDGAERVAVKAGDVAPTDGTFWPI